MGFDEIMRQRETLRLPLSGNLDIVA